MLIWGFFKIFFFPKAAPDCQFWLDKVSYGTTTVTVGITWAIFQDVELVLILAYIQTHLSAIINLGSILMIPVNWLIIL